MKEKNIVKRDGKRELVINLNVIEDLFDQRYAEVEALIKIVKNFPGSTLEELLRLFPCCKKCFNRCIAWLESQEIVYKEGDYYYLTDDWGMLDT